MSQTKDFLNVKQYNGHNQAPQKSDTVNSLAQIIKKNMTQLISVLPKHITPERMARVSLSTIRRNPKLCQCAPETLFMAILEASTLGLEIDSRGLVYLVPFWNSKTRTNDVQLMCGYRGMIELAYRSGRIQSIQASVVGENDKFDYARGLNPRLEHIPNLQDKGKIIAAYAIAIMKDGASQFEVMSLPELEKVRRSSRAADSGPWVDWTEQMYIKTVVKRLCKFLPLSPEMARSVELDDCIDAGIAQSFGETVDTSIFDIPQHSTSIIETESDNDDSESESNIVEIEAKPEQIPPRNGNGKKQTQKTLQEVQEVDESYFFDCPANGKKVTEANCQNCKQRKGCPAFEVM